MYNVHVHVVDIYIELLADAAPKHDTNITVTKKWQRAVIDQTVSHSSELSIV